MNRKSLLASVLVGFASLVLGVSAEAGTIVGTLVFTPDCTAIGVSGGGTLTYDRDNTGSGTESFLLEARDGSGLVVFTGTDTRSVGTTGVGFSASYAYMAQPTANPITVRLVSIAGNGFAEQTLATGVGSCSHFAGAPIPALDVRGLAAFALALAGAAFLALRRSMA
jgi:hypothetical protein